VASNAWTVAACRWSDDTAHGECLPQWRVSDSAFTCVPTRGAPWLEAEELEGIEESLAMMDAAWPFDGIMGFSQGAMLGAVAGVATSRDQGLRIRVSCTRRVLTVKCQQAVRRVQGVECRV